MKSACMEFDPGDVLYGRLRPYLNKVCRPTFSGLASAEFITFRDFDGVDPAFLKYALNQPDFEAFASQVNEGDRPRVKWSQIRSFPLGIPPFDEQQRIVGTIEEQFSRLDAGVESLYRARRNLARFRASVLRTAVEGRLVEQRSEEGSARSLIEDLLNGNRAGVDPKASALWAIPEAWVWTTIGQIFRVFVGATPSRSVPTNWDGDVPWVASGEVAFNRIRSTREQITREALGNPDRRLHPPGTVMLGMIGEGKTRGQVAVLDIWAAHNQNCASIRVTDTPILPEWVYWYLVSRYEETRRVGSGNNQPALNKTRVQQIPICIPPIAEQARIAGELERQFSVVDALEGALDSASTRAAVLRRTTLRDAFAGRLVTTGPGLGVTDA